MDCTAWIVCAYVGLAGWFAGLAYCGLTLGTSADFCLDVRDSHTTPNFVLAVLIGAAWPASLLCVVIGWRHE
jgi:hypothetical protein